MKQDFPGSTFVKMGRLLRNSFAAEFKTIFGDEISPHESRALGFIVRYPGTSQTEICKVFELTKSSGSEILASLIEKGFVEARINLDDRRGKHLFATPEGEKMEARAIAALEEHDKRLFADVSEEELEVAHRIYEKVAARMKGGKDGK